MANLGAKEARWFSAGMFVVRDPKTGNWYVLGRTSKKDKSARFIGGCEEPELNEASPEETLVREFLNESRRYNPHKHKIILELPKSKTHTQYFYFIEEAAGEVDFTYKAEGPEPDGEYIFISWFKLTDFVASVNPRSSHAKALNALLVYLAKNDPNFALENSEILPR